MQAIFKPPYPSPKGDELAGALIFVTLKQEFKTSEEQKIIKKILELDRRAK